MNELMQECVLIIMYTKKFILEEDMLLQKHLDVMMQKKNKWTTLCDTKNEHDEWPIILNDDCDANVIIIG